jgi:hypothetical protein
MRFLYLQPLGIRMRFEQYDVATSHFIKLY